ncbi:MAG: choice-of-anchor D domain-containing protein [Myxococcota bacterium]
MRWWVFAVVGGCSEYNVAKDPVEVPEASPVISVNPVAIDFGSVPYDEHPEQGFIVANVGASTLTLGTTTIDGSAFSLGGDPSGGVLEPGDQLEASVVFDGTQSGEQFGQVKIASDDPATPEATVDLRALAGLPGLLVEPNPIDFGVVEVGLDAVRSVTLTNTSSAPLDLVNAWVDEPFWLGLLQPITLAPNESRSMNIAFTPPEPLPYASQLVFQVTQFGDLAVDVRGEGNSTPKAVCAALPVNPIIPDESVTWFGSDSSDPAGRPLTYSWTLVAAPPGSSVGLPAGAGPDLAGFDPDELGRYTAELVVTNDLGESASCQASIVAVDTKPQAVCNVAPNPATALVDKVDWTGVGSSDPAGGALTYDWSLSSKPPGSSVVLPFGPATSPDRNNFVADLAGTYTGRLVVTNPYGVSSDPCFVDLEVIPGEDLWVEMFWSNGGEDMDLHLVRDAGALGSSEDCYYANCVGGHAWGAAGTDDNPSLDLDDIGGNGPENINVSVPEDLVYHVWVHDYPMSVRNADTDVTVNIYLAGLLAWTGSQTIGGEDSYTWFADIDWATRTVTP